MRPETKALYPINWLEIRQALLDQRGQRCESCGSQGDTDTLMDSGYTVITVHHIDYNPANNSPDNLLVLCSRCHLQLQQYELAIHNRVLRQLRLRMAGQFPLWPDDFTDMQEYLRIHPCWADRTAADKTN